MTSHRRPTVRGVLFGLTFIMLFGAIGANAATSLPAGGPRSAGTDTTLPSTDSSVVVSGRGEFSSLRLTVNQTRNLANQAISVSWTGGTRTTTGISAYDANYLQLMQCWGDDDGTNAVNPGPSPDRCVFGSLDGVYGGRLSGLVPNGSNSPTRIVTRQGWANFDKTKGTYDSRTGIVWKPFRAVDGTEVGVQQDPTYIPGETGSYWENPYFDYVTSNEIINGKTNASGEGSELFQVNTGIESSGLGCGQKIRIDGTGEPRIPKCWLVVVPRSNATFENASTGFGETDGVMTSPLADDQWKHRISIPLEFNPVDSPCSIDSQSRPIVGSELALGAVASWQPALCAGSDAPPYTFGTVPDAAARQQLVSRLPGAPGMAVTPGALDSSLMGSAGPVVYAPVTLSGLVIGFNIERVPSLVAPEESELAGVRVENMNLTPRLVAKLLTQSYGYQVQIADTRPYIWADKNPRDLSTDPDFLRFNPEFKLLQMRQPRNFGGLLMPGSNSDSSRLMWRWVLADPEARAWLDGHGDEWGMTVNPAYATVASANSTGTAFADPIPESFPKAEPYCYQSPNVGPGGTVAAPPLCGTDWVPYVQSFAEGSRFTRNADDRAKVTKNDFAISSDQVWSRVGPQYPGNRAMLTITDSSSARRFGIQVAQLSRAGDNSTDRKFVKATAESLVAGVGAMTASGDVPVLEADPSANVSDAYPLTIVNYAAVRPLALDSGAREDYAAFIDYAAGDGQVTGLKPGQLPVGYAPLPAKLKAQANEAALQIRTLQAPPTPAQDVDSDAGGSSSTGFPSTGSPGGRSTTATTKAPSTASDGVAEVAAVVATTPNAGPLTPILALARNRFFLVGLAVVAVVSSLGALEITKRPRRASGRKGATP